MIRQSLLKCAILLGLASMPNAAYGQSASGLEWRVKDRFRLFDRADQDARDAVTGLLDEIERAPPSAPINAFYPLLLRAVAGRGQAASLRRSNFDPADDRRDRTSGRYRHDYLWPDRYFIEIRDRSARPGELCGYASAIDRIVDRPCAQWTTLAVADGRRVSSAAWHVETSVTVERASGQSSLTISFSDELIVALGDSYISGEGNPDAPSEITTETDPVFRRYSWGGNLSPAQVPQEAQWWDEPCHRSLLSWPVLASLAHSARNPHAAVTLVHLGCSGAIADDVDVRGQRDLPGGGDETQPQLRLLGDLLRPPSEDWGARHIDTAFLSIGGNDAGFAGVIATLALPPNGFTLGGIAARAIGAGGGAVCPYEHSGRPLSRLCDLRQSSEARIAVLPRSLHRLAEKFVEIGMPRARTYQPLYPNPLLTADGLPCDIEPSANDSGFEALMGVVPRFFRGFRFATWRYELHYEPEMGDPDPWQGRSGWLDGTGPIRCDWAPEPGDSEVCQGLWVHASLNAVVADADWNILSGHLSTMARHGLCNASPDHPRAMPLVVAGEWRNGRTPASAEPRDPDSPRWFGLPNDSVVAQYGFHGKKRHFHNGTAHPSFRGHVEIAETAYRAAFGQQ